MHSVVGREMRSEASDVAPHPPGWPERLPTCKVWVTRFKDARYFGVETWDDSDGTIDLLAFQGSRR